MSCLKQLCIPLLTILTMAGCSAGSHDDPADATVAPTTGAPGLSQVISFTPASDETATRANQPLESTGLNDTFGVWGWKTVDGAEQAVFSLEGEPYRVAWQATTSSWDYTGADFPGQITKYWDLGATAYEFAAFSPCQDTDNVTFADGDFTIANLRGNTTDSPAWAVAHARRTMSGAVTHTDVLTGTSAILSAPTAPVSLTFKPLMAQVVLRAYNTEPVAVHIDGLQLLATTPVSTAGAVTLYGATGTTNWTYESGATATTLIDHTLADEYHFILTAFSLEEAQALESPLIELPQRDIATQSLKVRLHILGAADDEWMETRGSFSIDGRWAEGTRYVYTICLNSSVTDDEIVLVDVDVEKYKWEEGNDSDDNIFTDW